MRTELLFLVPRQHGESGARPNPELSLIIKDRFPDIDEGIINAYSKCRFLLRLKELNLNLDVVETQYKRRYRSHMDKYAESAASRAGKTRTQNNFFLSGMTVVKLRF